MAVNQETNQETLPTMLAAEIKSRPDSEKWLIKPLWTHMAAGLIGGHPKSWKSWLGLDMAVSIASGTPCMNHFPVEQQGAALVYLAEDALCDVRSRIESICRNRKLEIKNLPLHVITAPSFRLDLIGDCERLFHTISNIRPKMLLLDPLIRLHRLDENRAQEISGLLGYLRELQRTFNMAVVLVHHTSKKYRSHPGQTLRGSSDLHAFGDSNAYLTRKNDELILTVEHRQAPSPDPFTLDLVSSPDKNQSHLEVVSSSSKVQKSPTDQLADSVLELLKDNPSPLFRKEIRSRLKVNNKRLGTALSMLDEEGLLLRTPSGWTSKTAIPDNNRHTESALQLKLPSISSP